MKLALRGVWLLALVGLWFVMPLQVDPGARVELSKQLVEQWFTSADSPLQKIVRGGKLPELDVDLRTSPPIVDPEQHRSKSRAYQVGAIAWAEDAGVRISEAGQAGWPFSVRIGERGVQAELPLADGGVARCVRAFPTRWSLLPVFVVLSLAMLGAARLLLLLLSVVTTLLVLHLTALPGEVGNAWIELAENMATLSVAGPAVVFACLDNALHQRSLSRPWRWELLALLPGILSLAVVIAGQRVLAVELFVDHLGSWAPLLLLLLVVASSMAVTWWMPHRRHGGAMIGLMPLLYTNTLLLVVGVCCLAIRPTKPTTKPCSEG